MKIKICTKEIEIRMNDLKEKTVKALVEAIIAQSDDKSAKPENVKVFMKATKLDLSKTLEEEGVTDDTVLFTFIKKEMKRPEPTQQQVKPSATPNTSAGMGGNPMGGMGNPMGGMGANPYASMGSPLGANAGHFQGMGGMGGQPPISPEMIQQLLNDPAMVENTLNMIMPNATEEQKEMMRQQFKMFASNPEMMQMAMQMGGMGGINQGMGSPMGGMPNVNNYEQNPYGGMGGINQGMGSPMGGMNKGMNNQSMNQGMSPNINNNDYIRPDGSCSHGFYPLSHQKFDPSSIQDLDGKVEMLKNMGFPDAERNKQALIAAKGILEDAIEELTKKK